MRPLTGRRFASLGIILAVITLSTLRGTGATPPVISGEVVETYCWAKLRIGGTAHAACGKQCAARGIPVAVVDTKTRKLYVLLPGRDKISLPAELIAAMGTRVDIRGEIVTAAGANFVSVQSWEPAR
jgi:hypothetical protein